MSKSLRSLLLRYGCAILSIGLGIGLTLVRRLVEMHRGAVAAHSDGPGKGSEFVVRLPVHVQKERVDRTKRTDGSAPVISKPPRRVLVVDDNVDAAESLAFLLRLDGHDVSVANDGTEALTAVDANTPDIVLMDIGMPVINGYEVAKELRRRPGLKKKPLLVALTGWGQQEDRQRSQEAGFDHHLTKPVEPDALRSLLNHTVL